LIETEAFFLDAIFCFQINGLELNWRKKEIGSAGAGPIWFLFAGSILADRMELLRQSYSTCLE
jgi:hypothetical protein